MGRQASLLWNEMKTLQQLMDLRGRVACITGGAGHIGSVIGEALAELGANVVIADLSQEQCRSVATTLEENHHVKSFGMALDLTDERSLRAAPAAITHQFELASTS